MNTNTQPKLADLMVRFMNRPVDAASIEAEAGALGEVEPHEVAVGFRADPRLAWTEGLSVLTALGSNETTKGLVAPSEWAAVVVRHDAAGTQPFALAGYPQRVRDLTSLLQAKDLTVLRPNGENRPATPALKTWVQKQVEQGKPLASLLAASVLRAANDLDQAETVLNQVKSSVPESLKAVCDNEEASLRWQQGKAAEAVAIWERMPESPATLFNLGMAALFLGKSAKARDLLKKAVAQISEKDGWHHLGSLYLALAEMRNG
ncbi:MAG: hypothetical protein K8T89_26640 [Planctomycetes bacterium]|nr:hypothetical protein [Planctomycetota bacterium]